MSPKISIIVPNFNHKTYLRERLDTVFRQTFQDFEVILLDDASTDSSQEILELYKDHPKVSHLIFNSQNSGSPFKQWQKGINLAKGEYIWIAESDDTNDLSFLNRCYNSFSAEKNIGIVSTGLTIFSTKSKENFSASENGVYNGAEYIKQKMLKGNSLRNASGVVFLKKAVSENALQELINFKICGDWWLWVSILRNYNIYYIKDPLTNYRKHPAATTTNLNDNRLFYHEVYLLLKELKQWSFYNIPYLDTVLYFWIKRTHKSDIPIKQKRQLEKGFLSLVSLKGKVNQIKKNLQQLMTKWKGMV